MSRGHIKQETKCFKTHLQSIQHKKFIERIVEFETVWDLNPKMMGIAPL